MATKKKTSSEKQKYSTLSASDLQKELVQLQKNSFTLSMKHSLGELKQPHELRKVRKNIARIHTALNAAL